MTASKKPPASEPLSPMDTKTLIGKTPPQYYEKRIILALRKVMQLLDLHSKSLIKEYDITIPQVMCLYELAEKGAMTGAVLSKNIHLSASTIVGIIDRLEEKKLVTRARDLVDRRLVFVDITEKGRDFVQTAPNLLHNKLSPRLNKLAETDQILIANSIEMLVYLLQENEG